MGPVIQLAEHFLHIVVACLLCLILAGRAWFWLIVANFGWLWLVVAHCA